MIRHLVTASIVVCLGVVGAAAPPAMVKLINHGSDKSHLVIAVLGDGYAATDLATYKNDVDRLVVNGTLKNPTYAQRSQAFNLYRFDSVSNQSGISTNAAARDTFLHTKYTGGRCYIEEAPDSVTILERTLAVLPKYDYAIVLLNSGEYGGCAMEFRRLYVTRAFGPDVAIHELAHGVAKLYDEYTDDPSPYSGDLNDLNCSTTLNSAQVSWRGLLTPGAKLPSDGTATPVGMYSGCNFHSVGIFRPADDCKMKTLATDFCPVCQSIIRNELAKFSAQPAPPQAQPSVFVGDYVDLLVRVSREGTFEILDARDRSGRVDTSAGQAGDFVVALHRDGAPVSVTAVPSRSFEQHGYGPASQAGSVPHNVTQSATATIRLPVPQLKLSALPDSPLSVIMYRVGKDRPEILPTRILPMNIETLKSTSVLKSEWTLTAAKFQDAVRAFTLRK